MKKNRRSQFYSRMVYTLYFWPFVVMGARLVQRIALNLWQMFES